MANRRERRKELRESGKKHNKNNSAGNGMIVVKWGKSYQRVKRYVQSINGKTIIHYQTL